MTSLTIQKESSQPQLNGYAIIELCCAADALLLSEHWQSELIQWAFFHRSERLYLLSAQRNAEQLQLSFLVQAESKGFNEISCQTREDNTQIHQALTHPKLMLFASGLAMAEVLYLAKLRSQNRHLQTEVLLHSVSQFPFAIKPARIIWPQMPGHAIGASVLLEDLGIRNRLASDDFVPGTAEISANEFLQCWQQQASSDWDYIQLGGG